MPVRGRTGNHLLDAVASRELDRLRADLEEVTLHVGDPLFAQGERIEHVTFPTDAVVSLVTAMEGDASEVATIGREGVIGLPVFLGGGSTTAFMAVCQIAGPVLRIRAGAFEAAIGGAPSLRRVLNLYVQALLTQVIRNSACARTHNATERTARWLLLTHDRVANDTFPLTQEFLSRMLGVRRPTANVAARTLQNAGVIQYSRGRITVLDRERLEQASCECYRLVSDEYRRLLPKRVS